MGNWHISAISNVIIDYRTRMDKQYTAKWSVYIWISQYSQNKKPIKFSIFYFTKMQLKMAKTKFRFSIAENRICYN